MIKRHRPGYAGIAYFLNVEPSQKFLIFRKFAYLQTRVILDKQAELVGLEQQLRQRDRDDTDQNPLAMKSRSVDQQRENSTASILGKIEKSLDGYGNVSRAFVVHG